MELPLLAGIVLVFLALGYTLYGGFVARQFQLDGGVATPAARYDDGVDFVPTPRAYLFGQHFSAIAAAGPIVGPILACQTFGWLPALLWISLGLVFIGAVHDMSTLVASVRHEARSIAEVVKQELGSRAGVALLLFIWIALVYVIVAFTDVTSQTFVAGDPEFRGQSFDFNQGGAVAIASVLYLTISIVMGLVARYLKPPLWLQTVIFVPATLVAVGVAPSLSGLLVMPSALGLSPGQLWGVLILVYCFIASLVPVWSLLQPRGYLGGFILYMALAAALIGIFFGGFPIESPAFRTFNAEQSPTGLMFPFLFVTIACGACSGFHGLVCSGTTSKQVANEEHCKAVGYGAMLAEGFVAVIALATVMIALPAEVQGKAPGTVYGAGIGQFLTVLIGKDHLPFAITFGAMAFSTFVFDTLDVSTRLGRYVLQELFDLRSQRAALGATAITVGLPLLFILQAGSGAYGAFWTLFGTSNQLLAALSLLGISVWLKKSGRPCWYTLIPMLLVSAVTVSALAIQIYRPFFGSGSATPLELMNGAVALAMLLLASGLFIAGGRALLMRPAALAGSELGAA
jgi:carbon starvation protein